MKKFFIWLIVIMLALSLAACQDAPASQTDETTVADVDTPENEDTASDVENDADTPKTTSTTTSEETSPEYPDTWFDFSAEEPILDDSGDADINDIKRVYAANDDYYIYVAFEVDTDHIDSTTMINAGTCIFVGIDDPGYFSVNDVDNNTFADIDGNGNYYGQAAYRYENSILQIRVPLSIYDGASEFTINTLMRAKSDDNDKFDADTVDAFVYTIDS